MLLGATILFVVTWVGFLPLFTEIAKSDRDVKSGRIKLKDYWVTEQVAFEGLISHTFDELRQQFF